jgi:DNA-binding NarL/FixJ family response regulator
MDTAPGADVIKSTGVPAPTAAANAAAPTAIRILLVDDHPMVRDGLRLRLSNLPQFEVVAEAGTAEEALVCLNMNKPSVVVMDVGLKAGNGIELTQEMRQRAPEVRVLMFSMYDNAEYVQQALQAGASGYVLKDAPGQEIVTAIETVAAGGNFFSPALSLRQRPPPERRTQLSPRENEILAALARGESSKHIARALDLSVRTVEAHRQNIKRKLELEGQAELIKYAVEHAPRTRQT